MRWCAKASTIPTTPSRWRASSPRTLSANPTRLVEEAHTVPLFGGRRAVLVKAGARNIAPAVESLIAQAAGRMPRHHRGRRSAQDFAAAHAVRKGQARRHVPLLHG